MAQLWEYVKMAVSNIRMNRGRSFLTMLGIIIGVSSVILIMSIGNGAKAEMEEELTSVAGGQIYISVNSNLDGETPVITEEDREALRGLEHVKGATSLANQWCSVSTEKGNFDAIIDFGNPDSELSTSPDMLYGQWFTWDDYNAHRAVAVVSELDAIRMFGTSNVVGLTFEVDDGSVIQDVRIVGVKKAIEGTFVSSGYGSYLDISMPMTADWYWAEYSDFESVYIFAETGYAKEVTERAISLLESRHEIFGEDAFMSEDFDSQMASVMQVLDMITIFIMLVAGISSGRRDRRYEHHAGICYRTDQRDRDPESSGRTDEVHPGPVSGRIGDHHRDRRNDRDHPRNCGSVWNLLASDGHIPAACQHIGSPLCNTVFLQRGNLLRHLSGEEGGASKSDRGAPEKLTGPWICPDQTLSQCPVRIFFRFFSSARKFLNLLPSEYIIELSNALKQKRRRTIC